MTDHHHDTVVHDAQASAAPAVTPMGGARLRTFAIGAAIALVLLLVLTMLPRHSVSRELLADAAARDSAPVVQVATVVRAAPGSTLTLPGTVQPLHESAIYARVGGYVRRWSADIGTLVRTGTLLAEIDAPELEQNVQQARSQVQMTQAALQLAEDGSGALDEPRARQRRDEPGARPEARGVRVRRGEHRGGGGESPPARRDAWLHAHRGAVHRRRHGAQRGLRVADQREWGDEHFGRRGKRRRCGDVGKPVPRCADGHRAHVRHGARRRTRRRSGPGLEAQVDVQGLNGRHFSGRVVRTSASLDASTRTLLAEVDIPNRDFAILPGMYAQVTLNFPRVSPPIVVPASALVIRSAGPQVMVVDATGASRDGIGTLRLQSVQVGRDYGSTVEILDGLLDGTSIVTNPNADLGDGMRVRAVAAKN